MSNTSHAPLSAPNSARDRNSLLQLCLRWVASAFFLVAGFNGFSAGNWGMAIFVLLGAFTSSPLFAAWLNRKIGFAIPQFIYVIASTVGLITIGVQYSSYVERRDAKRAIEASQERIKRANEVRATAEADFSSYRLEILAQVQRMLDAGDAAAALQSIAKFSMLKDPDLVRLRDTASLITLRAEMASGKAAPARIDEITLQIARLDPSDIDAVRRAGEIIESKAKAEAAAKKVAEIMATRERVKSQFSGYDGSHHPVERAVKASMKDPSSYEHVSTQYSYDGGNTFTVITTFRGRNSFNALVPQTATAEVALDGQVVSLR